MTNWRHKCKLEWLKARQMHLCASDVIALLPVTKSGRPRTVGADEFIKVYAKKQVQLTEDDCISTGVMARGHILEPYAIEDFNAAYHNSPFKPNMPELYHWDDVVVRSPIPNGLAFSPDACDIPCPDGRALVFADGITMIGEIKSYSPDRHMSCGYTEKMKLDERWQIATAMAVSAKIEEAELIFYNPSMTEMMFVFSFSRKDLENEIELIRKVEESWFEFLDDIQKNNINIESYISRGRRSREKEIIEKIKAKEELDPDKTVW